MSSQNLDTKTIPERDKIISPQNNRAGLYIHYPFCIQKCDYCDFYSIGNGKTRGEEENLIFDAYIKEIQTRLAQDSGFRSRTIDTVFLGGGTPSRMDLEKLQKFMLKLREICSISGDAEISLEANPEDITRTNLEGWKEIGINRINMGYQSKHKKFLEYVGRYFEEDQYLNAPKLLSESGFSSYGYDLIYGYPDQTLDQVWEDLHFLSRFQPTHLSVYSLTVEPGTQYSRDISVKKKKKPEDLLQDEVFALLPDKMTEFGYEWYEVSNYAKPGFFSKHNLKYWTLEPYLGIGPGAHGYNGNQRYSNAKNYRAYLKDPIGTTQFQKSEPILEFAICLFRITQKIALLDFADIHLPQTSRETLVELASRWADQDFARYEKRSGIFQWKRSGISQLDHFISEFSEKASGIT